MWCSVFQLEQIGAFCKAFQTKLLSNAWLRSFRYRCQCLLGRKAIYHTSGHHEAGVDRNAP